jgi:hypothetical protein
VKAATVQRIIQATDAKAIAPPGASTRTDRGPINSKTKTSDNTDSDQRALMPGNPVPAARRRITENESYSAWLPSTRAAIMGKRRKASICRRTAQSRVVERARLLDEVGAAGILGSNRAAAPPIPSSVPLNQTMLARPVSLTVQPLSSVPTMNAVEPDARSHPYSNRLPSPVSLLRAAVVASASESGTVGASIAAVHERHQEQTRKASYHHVAQPCDGRHESTSAEHHGVPSHPISDVTDRRPSKDADRSEGSEDNADFLGVQPRPLSSAGRNGDCTTNAA